MSLLLLRKPPMVLRFALGSLGPVRDLLGTWAVAGGALQVATLGDHGRNLVTNGEFTTDTTGWTAGASATIAQVDSASDPGVASGGADNGAVRVTGGPTSNPSVRQSSIPIVPGATYRWWGRVYPDATGTYPSRINWISAGNPSSGLGWQELSPKEAVAVTSTATMDAYIMGTAPGVTGLVTYFDAIHAHRQNAVSPLLAVGPTATVIADLTMPAAAVTPFGLLLRCPTLSGRLDWLNGWEVRLLPNTAGNDCQIVELVAGVETVRAEADVDWTSAGADRIKVTTRGSTLTVYAMKAGASTWTQVAQYASMTTQLNAPWAGLMGYGTDGPTVTRAEVQPWA